MLGRLQRYVMAEVLAPLGAWLSFLFLLLWVMAFLRATDVLLGSAVTPLDVGQVTLLLAPHFLAQAAPPAFLLALLLGFGRLADDRELIAMSSLGVGPLRLTLGPVALSLGVSGVLLALACSLQPWGLNQVRELGQTLIARNLANDVRPGLFHDALDGFTLYTEGIAADGTWKNVLVHDGRDPSAPLLILAQRGGVHGGVESGTLELSLQHGEMHQAREATQDDAQLEFQRGTVKVGLQEAFFQKNRLRSQREEMSPQELWAQGPDARLAFHWRVGQAFMPLGFAFLGAPLGLLRRSGGRARGALFTLGAYLGYYVLARLFLSMGDRGVLPAFVAGNLANFVFIAAGAVLLFRLERKGLS